MVVSIDLKPLSEETIKEMGYNNHDLWMVKIDSIVFGPFETETLKHYVHDNEHLFEAAEASRVDEADWKPFWEYTRFQRRKPQVVAGERHEGPFWIMHAGLKVGPFTNREIDKKIEMDLLGMTDHISVDNGETWIKIYQIADFDRRSHSPDELPIAPTEASFQEAKIAVLEKVSEPHINTADELAELAFEAREAGKVIQLKLEEMALKQPRAQVEVSASMKWAAPTAVALLVTVASGGYLMMGPEEELPVVAEQTEEKPFYQKPATPRKSKVSGGSVPSPSLRAPASVGYNRPQPTPSSSRYPTYTETHDQFPDPHEENLDPIEQPINEVEQAAQEHSLVTQQQGTPEENSLDAAMNGTEQPQQPVVEEASDF